MFTKDPKGLAHAGNVMSAIGRRGSPYIVKLEVKYKANRILRHNDRTVQISHYGHIGNWTYEKDQDAIIVKDPIPLKDIKLVGEYNTVNKLK